MLAFHAIVETPEGVSYVNPIPFAAASPPNSEGARAHMPTPCSRATLSPGSGVAAASQDHNALAGRDMINSCHGKHI